MVLAAIGSTIAGNLNPPGRPAPTIVTLQQIVDRQHPGSDCGSTAFGTRPVRNGR
jgi:hypothetical protein